MSRPTPIARPRPVPEPANRRRRRQDKSPWGWLLLGVFGLLAALVFRRSEPPRTQRRSRPQRSAPPEEPPESGLAELPPDAVTSWIPGPGGSLRICERNRRGALPILFVHGLGGRLEHWAAELAALGPLRRGVALDLSGHGGSDPAAGGDYSIPALAADVGAVADALRLRRFVLVGHSLGALVAAEYAATHSDRVSGLFLVDPSGDQTRLPAEERESFLATLRRDPSGEMKWYFEQLLSAAPPDVAEQVLADLAATPEDALLAALESAAAYSPLPALERYSGPVAAVVSDLNNLPHSLPSLLPELPVTRLESTSHWLMLDRPATFRVALQAFLDALRDRLRPATVH